MHMLFAVVLFAAIASADAMHSVWQWENDDFPPLRTSDGPFTPSACGNGGYFVQNDEEYAYSCPHHAMFSDDMVSAVKYDGHYGDFIYATAGGYSDAECGTGHVSKFSCWTPSGFGETIFPTSSSRWSIRDSMSCRDSSISSSAVEGSGISRP